MVTEIWVNIAVGQQAITWTNLDSSSVKSSDIHIRAISQEMSQTPITKIHLKLTFLKRHPNFPAASEVISLFSRKKSLPFQKAMHEAEQKKKEKEERQKVSSPYQYQL